MAAADPLDAPARWAVVETAASLSNDDDATVRVPAANAADPAGDYATSLYTAELLATVSDGPCNAEDASPSAPVVPQFFAATAPDGVCLVVETQIHVLDGACMRLETTISLDCPPDAVAWSAGCTFLVVADRLGSLHFLHVPSRSILFSQELLPTEGPAHDGRTFAALVFRPCAPAAADDSSTDAESTHELIVVAACGNAFRFSNVDLHALQRAIAAGDFAAAKAVKAAIRMERFSVAATHPEGVADACFIAGGCGPAPLVPALCTAGRGPSGIATWSCGGERVTPIASVAQPAWRGGIRRVRASADGRHVAVLASGSLALLDPHTLLTVALVHGAYADAAFLVPEANSADSGSNGESDDLAFERAESLLSRRPTRLIALKEAQNANPAKGGEGSARMLLEVRNLDSLSIAYACGVGRFAVLSTALGSTDQTHVAEFRDGGDGRAAHIALRLLRESLPTSRFYRLLHKRRFDEAKAFAKNFGLDIELVYQVQLTAMLDAATVGAAPGATAASLIDVLKLVSDEAYVVDFCVEAALPTVEDTRKLIDHARALCTASPAHAERLPSLFAALRRLGTYAVAFDGRFDGRHWQDFRAGNMLQQLCACLASGRLHAARAIWCRHGAEESLSTRVRAVIASIAEDCLPSSAYVEWLAGEVVGRLSSEEDAAFLLSWVEKRARVLEVVEPQCWPQNALDVIALVAKTAPPVLGDGPLDATPGQVAMRYMSFCRLNESSSLAHLRRQLEDIAYLMANHGIRLSLADYAAETPATIAYALLDRVAAAELVPSTVDGVVRPYLQRHNFPVDKALLHYVAEAIGGAFLEGAAPSAQRDSPREAWIIAAIGCMADVELRAEAVIELMRHTAVPWSDAVDAVMRSALAWTDHSRREEIAEQFRLLELRRSLARHGISRDVNMSDVSQARGLMRRLVSRTDVPEAFDDALRVVGAYNHLTELEAHVARIQDLFVVSAASAIEHVRTRLPRDLAALALSEVIEWLVDCISTEVQLESDGAERLRHLDAGVALFNFLAAERGIAGCLGEMEIAGASSPSDVARRLLNIASLQREYGEVVNPSEYAHESSRLGLAARYVCEFVSAGLWHAANASDSAAPEPADPLRKPSRKRATERSRLFRVGDLLLVPRQSLQLILAEELARAGETDGVMGIVAPAQDDGGHGTETHAYVQSQHVVHALLESVARGDSVLGPVACERLRTTLMRSLAECPAGDLCDTLELFRSLDVAATLIENCEVAESNAADGAIDALPGLSTVPDWLATTEESTPSAADAASRPVQTPADDVGAWLSESHYSEDGLVMQGRAAVSLAAKYALACFPDGFCEGSLRPYACRATVGRSGASDGGSQPHKSIMAPLVAAGRECIKLACDNRHSHVGLRLASHGIAACSRHLAVTYDGGALLGALGQIGKASAQLVDDLLLSLSRKVLSAKAIDEGFAVGLATARADTAASLDAVKEALEVCHAQPHSAEQAPSRLARRKSIATVGLHISSFFGFAKQSAHYATQRMRTNWRQRLLEMGVPADEQTLQGSASDDDRLVHDILRLGDMDLSLALSYCVSHGVSQDVALGAFVEHILLRADGRPAGMADRARAAGACERMSRDTLSALLLDRILPRVSPYDYDTLGFVLTCATKLVAREDALTVAKRGLLLIDVLRFYDRRAPPSQWERSFVPATSSPTSGSTPPPRGARLSPLERDPAQTRLPFHALIECDPWLVLAPEIAPATVPRLLPLAKALLMTADQFHVRAIHIMAQLPACERFPFALSARPSLVAITDPEVAIATAKFAADHVTGREKIEAFETAVEIATRWRDEQRTTGADDKAERTLARLKELCTRTATEHALREYGLDDALHLSLVGKPQELVTKLYLTGTEEGRSAAAGEGSCGSGKRTLLSLVDEIASRNGLSADKIRREIVHKWIVNGHDGGETDASVALRRIQYLLQREPREQCVSYMLNVAFLSPATKTTDAARVRALSLLFLLANPSTVAAVYKGPAYEVGDRMQQLQYVCTLAQLHTPQTVEEFSAANKEGLAKGLVRNHPSNPVAVRMAADLCLDSDIRDAQLWTALLQLLSRFGMLSYMRYALGRLSAFPEVCQVPGLAALWTSVLQKSLAALASAPANVESLAADVVRFALQCPLVLEVDMRPLVAALVSKGLLTLAVDGATAYASLNPVIGLGAAKDMIRNVLKDTANHAVVLAALASHGQGSVCVEELRACVYEDIDARAMYGTILSGPFFGDFVRHAIATRSIDRLLAATITAGRIEKAGELVAALFAAHPDMRLAKPNEGATEDATTFSVLEAYLESRGMSEALAQVQNHAATC